ncbi:MAG: Rab family GTPase [Candidatus Kariarchaeaceae archaeon]
MSIKYKVIILGEAAVGKTSLRERFMGKGFKHNYGMTIGADFAAYALSQNERNYTLQIFDLAGEQRFSDLNRAYYMGTNGAMIVFDVTRMETYAKLSGWVDQLITNMKDMICPIVLVGNKSDLRDQHPDHVTQDMIDTYVDELTNISGFKVKYFDTSALTGDNVKEAFHNLVETIDYYNGM